MFDMVSTKIDYIFREMKSRGMGRELHIYPTPLARINAVNEMLMVTNITKCTLADLDMETPGSAHYIIFLFQNEYEVDMGLCPFYKMWHNSTGEQERCYFNSGHVQVHCSGLQRRCEHENEFEKYEKISHKDILGKLKKKQHI